MSLYGETAKLSRMSWRVLCGGVTSHLTNSEQIVLRGGKRSRVDIIYPAAVIRPNLHEHRRPYKNVFWSFLQFIPCFVTLQPQIYILCILMWLCEMKGEYFFSVYKEKRNIYICIHWVNIWCNVLFLLLQQHVFWDTSSTTLYIQRLQLCTYSSMENSLSSVGLYVKPCCLVFL